MRLALTAGAGISVPVLRLVTPPWKVLLNQELFLVSTQKNWGFEMENHLPLNSGEHKRFTLYF